MSVSLEKSRYFCSWRGGGGTAGPLAPPVLPARTPMIKTGIKYVKTFMYNKRTALLTSYDCLHQTPFANSHALKLCIDFSGHSRKRLRTLRGRTI